jgi:hypothetical protein
MKLTLLGSEMGMIPFCRTLVAIAAERNGRRWRSEEWDRFVAAARHPSNVAHPRAGLLRLIGGPLVATVHAVEQMRVQGWDGDRINRALHFRQARAEQELRARPSSKGYR